jgi:hypothetical protein
METRTINQLANTATEVESADLIPIWQDGKTKKITAQNFFKSQSAGGLAFIGTRAEYEVAKLIPEGSTGFIPSGTLVCITDEEAYIMGENITVNRNRRGNRG